MSRFTRWQSHILGRLVERVAISTGGTASTESGLRVCQAGWLKLYAKGGTQWGDTFVSGRTPNQVSAGLILHEKHHRDAQWRRYGWWFAVMYFAAQVRDVWIGNEPFNRYELAAEEASNWGGGYPRI